MDKAINKMFRVPKADGEVGIEIEMEGRSLPNAVERFWRVDNDGSLRGNSREYTLSKPLAQGTIVRALKALEDEFKANGSTLKPSDRCGVHVHLNCQKLTGDEVVRVVCLYLILENLLVRYCGEDREGNLFCLRAQDAEGLAEALAECVAEDDLGEFARNDFRYASINLASLSKYGSLEFRSLRTPKHLADIKTWVDMLIKIKQAALDYESPQAMIENMSAMGAERFVEQIMTDHAELLAAPNMRQRLFDGVRIVQDVAYARKKKKKTAVKKKPRRAPPEAGRFRVRAIADNEIQWEAVPEEGFDDDDGLDDDF